MSENTPPDLPADSDAFFAAGPDIDLLTVVPAPPAKHVLEQLGPPPFRKTSFPMMGFLATFYEHVATHVSAPGDPPPAPPPAAPAPPPTADAT